MLADELKSLGLVQIHVDEHAIVTAVLPATVQNAPRIGFVAHLDTVDVALSPDAHPQILRFDGSDVCLNTEKNIWLRVAEHPELLPYTDQDIIFTDGTQVGALLDRNGFRPGRWQVTDDGYVVLASETGVLPEVAEEHIVTKGRLEPGKMFLVDTDEGRIIPDEEIKKTLASQHPYRKWVEGNSVELSQLPKREHVNHSGQSVQRRQRAFGYTEEDLKLLLAPMANTGKEPLGSMVQEISGFNPCLGR